jgi:thiosulfate/3-mercaptopyruvate sulfurtransferase
MMRVRSQTTIAALLNVIEPRELAARLSAKDRHNDLIVVHVAEERSYLEGHVPGALHVLPRDLVGGQRPATGLLPSRERLEHVFASLGHRDSATYVAYDDEGGGWAGRFIWTLDAVGIERWLYVDGGIHAWRADGLPIEREARTATPRAAKLTVNLAPVITAEEILNSLGDPHFVYWDSRSREEYEGRKVVAARGGHIPGAKHLDWLELMDRARELRLRRDLSELLASRGITPDKTVVPYCQTHHRSALSYLVARCLGYPRVRAYAGSWSEWGNRDDTPVANGP